MKMKKTTNPILVSGDAQVSSPCGSHCGDRERPISQLLHPPDRDGKDVEDDAIRVSSIGKDVSGPLNYLMIVVAMGWLLRNFKVGEREKERKKGRDRDR